MKRTVAQALDAFEQFAVVALKALGARDPDGAAPAFVALVDGFALHRLARPRPRADEVALLRRGLRALFLAEIVDPGELAPGSTASATRSTPRLPADLPAYRGWAMST